MSEETALVRKRTWQNRNRQQFSRANGFSSTANYGCGGLRGQVLERDKHACIKCGMTDADHRAKWGRPITVDHKDRNRKNNTLENLQTLCLSCHGRKDISPHLVKPKRLISVQQMADLRQQGSTFREIGQLAGIDASRCRKLILKGARL